MSWGALPSELTPYLHSFLTMPVKITQTEIRQCARNLKYFSLINPQFQNAVQILFDSKIRDLKRLHELVGKYSVYNEDYEKPGMDLTTGKPFDPKGNPHLLDAVSSGCDFLPCTFKLISVFYGNNQLDELVQDIKDLIRLTPQSMNCILGTMRNTDGGITPLALACFNRHISAEIIELLLVGGADQNAVIIVL